MERAGALDGWTVAQWRELEPWMMDCSSVERAGALDGWPVAQWRAGALDGWTVHGGINGAAQGGEFDLHH